MKDPERAGSLKASGFTVPELVFLVILVAVFLTGTVVMVNRGFETGSAGTGTGNGPALLKHINAMLTNSRFIDAPLGVPIEKLKFAADIDDDASTGFDLPYGKGLELVEIARDSKTRNRLVATVATGKGRVKRVIMSSTLDRRVGSFTAKCIQAKGSGTKGAGSVLLRVWMREGNTARQSLFDSTLRFTPVKTR